MKRALIFALLLTLSACSSAPPSGASTPAAPIAEAPDPILETPLAPPSDDARRKLGVIGRVELDAFLDQGPAYLLQRVPVEPIVDEGKLIGFQIQSFFKDHPRLAQADLQPGDVIIAVNATRIVYPEDLFTVWSSLRDASHIQVDLIRGQSLLTRTWHIE